MEPSECRETVDPKNVSAFQGSERVFDVYVWYNCVPVSRQVRDAHQSPYQCETPTQYGVRIVYRRTQDMERPMVPQG